jgi:hypothetical protein
MGVNIPKIKQDYISACEMGLSNTRQVIVAGCCEHYVLSPVALKLMKFLIKFT